MDFNCIYKTISRLILISLITFIFIGCSEKEKNNTSNTYYLEIVNFNDSLKQYISENIFGKVAYFNKNKLEIISLNFATDEFPDMHYFKNITELERDIKPDTKKIKIEFNGNYSIDSINYSLQKYKYSNKQWIKISDMGTIKGTTSYKKAKEFAINEFGKQVINNTVLYSYN